MVTRGERFREIVRDFWSVVRVHQRPLVLESVKAEVELASGPGVE